MWRLIHLSRVHPRMKYLSAALHRNSHKHGSLTGNASREEIVTRAQGFLAGWQFTTSSLTNDQESADSTWELSVYLRRKLESQVNKGFCSLYCSSWAILPSESRKKDVGQKEELIQVNGSLPPPLPSPGTPMPFGSSEGVLLTAHHSITPISSVQHSAWHNLGF